MELVHIYCAFGVHTGLFDGIRATGLDLESV